MFIVDPLYTVPLLVGAGWALATRGSARGLRANTVGLVLSTCYLAWSGVAQQYVERIARASLAQQGIAAEQVLVTPAPLNTVLWRVVAMSGAHYHEGFYSLLDAKPTVQFDRFDRGQALASQVQRFDSVQRIAAFSHGFYKLDQIGNQLLISDLRMGQEPNYVFSFVVAERPSDLQALQALEKPVQQGTQIDLNRGLAWLWRRMLGEPVPPPR
jgi:inner membrane protein